MKAAVVTEIGKIEILDLPMPKPNDYEVLCEMRYGATCTGTDTHILVGCPWGIKYPIIMGHESIGKVVEIGAKVRHYKIGDYVTRVGAPSYPELGINNGGGFGGYAQYGIAVDHWAIKADNAAVKHGYYTEVHQIIPQYIDERVAPLFITLRETLSYTRRIGCKKGDSVLILGSGGNGLAFALHSHLTGAKVVMIGNLNKSDKASLCGADDFYSYKDENFGQALRDKYPAGFDLLIDAVGESRQLAEAMHSLRNRGTLGIYGENEFGRGQINPRGTKGSFFFYNEGYNEPETHIDIVDYFREGRINPAAFVDVNDIRPLGDLAAVFEDIKAKRLKDSKALIQLFD